MDAPAGFSKEPVPARPLSAPDQTILLSGEIKKPDEMQVIWSKTEIVRSLTGKKKIIPDGQGHSFKVVSGPDKGKVFPLGGKSQFSIGRSDADISLRDPRVSKLHCLIEFYEGLVVIKDMNSTNGSLLNQFVLAEDFMKAGDRLQIGHTTLDFQVHS
jgi:hypothetical protein